MVRPVRLLVRTEGLHRPALRWLSEIQPVPVMCVEGFGTMFKTNEGRYYPEVSLGHSLWPPNSRSNLSIESSRILDFGCFPLSKVRFFMFSEDLLRYVA